MAEQILCMLFADKKGRIYHHLTLEMGGFSQNNSKQIYWDELIPLPPHSKLFYIPEALSVGRNPNTGQWIIVKSIRSKNSALTCYAVAAFIPPGYVRLHLPAADYSRKRCDACCLECLSRQPEDSCVTSHERIAFRPHEIVEVAIRHFVESKDPILSFDQGCEREPRIELHVIIESIWKIGKSIAQKIINLNANFIDIRICAKAFSNILPESL